MSNVAVTIRIPSEQIEIIDEYAKEIENSRSDILRLAISDKIEAIKAMQRKEQLIKASKKVTAASLKENHELTATLEDGLD